LRDWWRQALVGALLLSAAFFVFWPRIADIMRLRPTPATLAPPTTRVLEGDGDDE
jgi:hypothetical protein